MPQVVAAIPAWATYAYYAAVIIYSAYDSSRRRRNARRDARNAYNASLRDRLNMVSTADGARSRVYGQVRNVDGVLFKATHGSASEFYTLVVALAGHQCESIDKVYFNDQEVALTSDGAGGYWVNTAPYVKTSIVTDSATMTNGGGGASVTLPHTPIAGSLSGVALNVGGDGSPPSWVDADFGVAGATVSLTTVDPSYVVTVSYQYQLTEYKARVWKYLGTDSQDIGSDLLASRFPSLINTGTDPETGLPNDDRFAGCCLVVELEFDQDAFPTGVPNVTALIKGANDVYDPRTGLTGWTQNPALIARDWSLYENGGACAESELVEAAFIAAANACDVSTNFTTADGIETRPLYQCDIVCKLDSPPDQGWLAEIVESMAGKWGWAGGQLTLVAGVYRAPVATITEDWISDHSDIAIVKDVPISDVVNVYRPTIANADAPVDGTNNTTAAYAMAVMPEVRSAAYIAADGTELPREVELGGVTHNVHAQHICGVMMRDARYGMTLSLPCKMHAWQLELFDVVYVTLPIFGFDAEQFEVVGWQFSPDKGITLTLKQIDASIFDPAANFPLPNTSLNTSLVLPWVVEDITGLTVTDAPQDGTQQSRALVTWDPVVAQSVRQSGKVEVQYVEVSAAGTLPAGDWASWLEEGSAEQAIIPGVRSDVYYLFRARAINSLGVRGAWTVQALHAPGVPLIDTPQIAPGAATAVYIDNNASQAVVASTFYSIVTRNLPEAGTYEITVTARYEVTSFTSADRLQAYFSYSGAGTADGDPYPTYSISANGQRIMLSQSATVTATGAGPWQMNIVVSLTNGTSAGTLYNTMMRTTLIRR